MDCLREQKSYKWRVPSENVLWTENIDVAHDFVLRSGGESLHTIIIGDNRYGEVENAREMVPDFLNACPNVRSLSVVDQSGVWASAFAAKLEKLEVVSENPNGAVPKYCPSVIELDYSYEEDPTISSVLGRYLHIENKIDLKDIEWSIFGSTLQSLRLTGEEVEVTESVLDRIRRHCHNLKHIDISKICTTNDSVMKFVASYGDQVETVHVYYWNERETKHVVGKCRNARFHVEFDWDFYVLPNLKIRGSRLETVKLDCTRGEFVKREWRAAWHMCSTLKILIVRNLKVTEIRAIMHTPKDYLKEIRIHRISRKKVMWDE